VRDEVAGPAEQAQEAVEHGGRVGRGLARIGVEAAQVHEEHLDRLLAGERVTGPHDELGLADSRHPGDHHRLAGTGRGEHPVDLGGPAGEAGQAVRQGVLDPHLGRGAGLAGHHPQRLLPLRHVARFRP
jgi:hypothetical protein